MLCDDTATLVFLADQACITAHRFLSRASRPNHPDRLVFDFDPPDDDFALVRQAALQLHELLDELRLPSVAMTSGSRGLHVIVPWTAAAPSTTSAPSPAASPTCPPSGRQGRR
ncbi:hypothetical protein [Kitasatospora sp. NPDC058190]|uniref:non-homologous end-joining DNA ligase LigD n=1 Tax=Kitasatospora sp. NPDC058190 TaxID=3346371 RepID=UPI0036DEBFEC